MVSTTAAVVVGDGIVKISGTGAVVVVVVVVAAGTNVATAGMTAGWNWVASTAAAAATTTTWPSTEVVRSRVRMVVGVDGRRGG